jgi:transcriptional regulator with GAF, ATPase, and Fis domain
MTEQSGGSGNRQQLPDRIESEHQLEALMSMVSGVQLEFGRNLQRIAESGLGAVPAADGVGVALLQDGRLDHLAATAPFVADVDDAQYGTMQGPCVTAAVENRTVIAASMITEDRWPALRAQIAPVGVHSALSIPLTVGEHLIGTLNIYARQRDAFDASIAARGEQYAQPAAVALQEACVIRRARLVTERLGGAVERRRILNRTLGLLMAQDGVEAAEARAMLDATARALDEPLTAVAQAVWDERIASACLPPSDDAVWALRQERTEPAQEA